MSVIAPFPRHWDRRPIASFDRLELARILDLYGRMVAAGHWRDYALRIDPQRIIAPVTRSDHAAVEVEDACKLHTVKAGDRAPVPMTRERRDNAQALFTFGRG